MPQRNMTEDEYTKLPKRHGRAGVAQTAEQRFRKPPVAGATPVTSSSPFAPYRSKLEAAWANYLTLQVRGGEIANFYYEPLNLRLPGKKNFYKPDFLVLAGDGLTFYEVKGWSRSNDRSLVKLKTAAGITPWAKFVLVKRVHGAWEEKVIV